MVNRVPAGDTRPRLVCERCGNIEYHNPRVVAATVTSMEDGIVLIRRSIEPSLGLWSYPGGYMEMDESVEEAAIRETREETGLTVRVTRLLNAYSRPSAGVVVIVYLAEPIGGVLAAGDECSDARIFAAGGIPWEKLAFPTVTAALCDWLKLENEGQQKSQPL